MRPGELSLANHGVLFLDELAEFIAPVLDGLRQPLEEGVVRVSRAKASVAFPAKVSARRGDEPVPVRRRRSSGRVPVQRGIATPLHPPRLRAARRSVRPAGADHATERRRAHGAARRRVRRRRSRRESRRRGRSLGLAASRRAPRSTGPRLDELAPLSRSAAALLRRELEAGRLSGRGLHRVRRVARTLADLHGADEVISDGHVAVALQLRVEPVAHDGALR